ncbi:hypothetical protein RIF29_16361 [Crotalaria pallida]|uniref:Uncharacterized protein n=1 Tax=Crotalaria pallida TaxID=3830 RepID=A0AAN9FIR7_CROPI
MDTGQRSNDGEHIGNVTVSWGGERGEVVTVVEWWTRRGCLGGVAMDKEDGVVMVAVVTFLVAEACLIAGALKNAYHTKYRGVIYAQTISCETLREGVFVIGSVFVIANMVINVYYYIYYTKATTTTSHKGNHRVSSIIGMT